MPEPTPPDNAARKSTPTGTPDTFNNSLTGPAGSLDSALRGSALPDRIGRFRIKGLLGEGAFARVYLGIDPELEREVAIKVPKVEELTPEFRESFLRENRLAAIIQHPNICPVYEVGTDGGFPYIVMRVVPGTLAGLLKRLATPMPPKSAAAVVRKLALGLVAAHAQKVIHRDLKPANVLYDEANREVLIADFGLARFADQATDASNGVPKGTPAYMSPEQARGQADKVGPLSDVYSLGIMLYEMLTGRVPFTGSIWEVMRDHCETTPALPSQVRIGVDPELDTIVLKALAKHPADRYASAKALAAALGDYLMLAERGGSVPLFALPTEPQAPKRPSAAAFEVVPAAAPEPKPKPEPKPEPKAKAAPKPPAPVAVTLDEDEDEEEEEDTTEAKRPARKEKKRKTGKSKKRGAPLALWLGIGGVAIGAVILVVVLVAGKKKPEQAATPNPAVTGPSEAEKKEAERKEAERKETEKKEAEKKEAEKKLVQAKTNFEAGEDYYIGRNGKVRDYVKARELYESAARLGHASAQYKFGQMCASGLGGAMSYVTAREWYERAALQDYADAQNNIGSLLYNGQGGPKDVPKAREWWEKAARQNHPIAQCNLGLSYEAQGSAADYLKAREWYEKSARQDHTDAQNRLGDMYYHGRGGPRDYPKSREWYEKAAQRGYAAGQRNLGRAFDLGLGAVYDQTTALVWYRKAAAQGDDEARKAVERLEKMK